MKTLSDHALAWMKSFPSFAAFGLRQDLFNALEEYDGEDDDLVKAVRAVVAAHKLQYELLDPRYSLREYRAARVALFDLLTKDQGWDPDEAQGSS